MLENLDSSSSFPSSKAEANYSPKHSDNILQIIEKFLNYSFDFPITWMILQNLSATKFKIIIHGSYANFTTYWQVTKDYFKNSLCHRTIDTINFCLLDRKSVV